MENLSRKEKYKDLRERLQHDNGSDISTKELSRFEKRLNNIDADNFAAPKEYNYNEYDGAHMRKKSDDVEVSIPTPQDTATMSLKDIRENENYSNIDENDYLDQYIKEVKEYNIEQGRAASEDTSVNVLQQLKADRTPKEDLEIPPIISEDTTEVPSFTQSMQQVEEKTDELELPQQEVKEEPSEPSQTFSKEDIMAEVQSLVTGKRPPKKEEVFGADAFNLHLEADRTARQQLLNETTQMRAQLDDYEDNLTEVNDKMRQTNNMLNLVLIVVIIALIVMLGVIFYWVFVSRGV